MGREAFTIKNRIPISPKLFMAKNLPPKCHNTARRPRAIIELVTIIDINIFTYVI
jgi:hypothetical protein